MFSFNSLHLNFSNVPNSWPPAEENLVVYLFTDVQKSYSNPRKCPQKNHAKQHYVTLATVTDLRQVIKLLDFHLFIKFSIFDRLSLHKKLVKTAMEAKRFNLFLIRSEL